VGVGGEIADALAQGNGMLAHNRPPIAAGRPQIWLELLSPTQGCFVALDAQKMRGALRPVALSFYFVVISGVG